MMTQVQSQLYEGEFDRLKGELADHAIKIEQTFDRRRGPEITPGYVDEIKDCAIDLAEELESILELLTSTEDDKNLAGTLSVVLEILEDIRAACNGAIDYYPRERTQYYKSLKTELLPYLRSFKSCAERL